MAVHNALQEVVLLFDDSTTRIERGLSFQGFESLVAQTATLPERAASVVKAAYVVVGIGLSVRGIVFFQCRLDEDGLADGALNLPLRYLVRHAGLGPDLEIGRYRLACRSQCPVPWHSLHLWEPRGDGENHPVKIVQKAVWRGGLDLQAVPATELTEGDLELTVDATVVDAPSPVKPTAPEPGPAPTKVRRPAARTSRSPEVSAIKAVAVASVRAERARHERRLTATFGEEGRLNIGLLTAQHRQQIEEICEKYRAELDEQQRNYLEQIRNCRDEIQKLKAALRNEQDRNRRLQGLLRGGI